ncbi:MULTISPECIES: alpha/beta fold hydrolase [unclassified Variovorax]|uniref:alpha/beta fold hydrolase n=1 Tax=unclassified Variovorax TaxID=663243 RepID=UPI001BD55C06|nr:MULTISPECIES: alpha/beta fold hydrolase [unclassified Variovorax]
MEKRTYLLVHGGSHGGWCWRDVAAYLRAAGHAAQTPTQTGLGERRHLLSPDITLETYVDDIANVIEAEELEDVFLVGHSFGGCAVVGVAERMPRRLRHLVFLDSLIPMSGKSIMSGFPPDVREARLAAADAFSGGLCTPVPPATNFGLSREHEGDATVDWVQRRLTPQPLKTYLTSLTLAHPVGNGVPATYIRCTDPLYDNVAPSAAFARAQPGWDYRELKTGHDAMISAPREPANMLLGIQAA